MIGYILGEFYKNTFGHPAKKVLILFRRRRITTKEVYGFLKSWGQCYDFENIFAIKDKYLRF
jgi:hypothetical protein